MRRIIKLVRWYLKGRPRCQVCGKPLYNYKGGNNVGSGCALKAYKAFKEVALAPNALLNDMPLTTEDKINSVPKTELPPTLWRKLGSPKQ